MIKIKFVKKRDGALNTFSSEKITTAIYKALKTTGNDSLPLAQELSSAVIKILEKEKIKHPYVEHIQDVVEQVLMQNNLFETARSYIMYRAKRSQIRQDKEIFGVEDRLKLSLNAIHILKKRYLLKDKQGRISESPEKMFHRVAKAVADAEKNWPNNDISLCEEKFYSMMQNLEFLPNSPTLMNAGTNIGQLSACFVLPVPDSIKGIFEALKNMAIIHQSGGGTGFSFSHIRPKGDIVRSTMGVASGPISFIEIFDKATEVVKQGGKRRGANMGIMRIDHPDIFDFITTKRRNILTNFNISIAATDMFMEKVIAREKFDLINPKTGKRAKTVPADELFDIICQCAWETGDPGLIFIDEINRKNPTPLVGYIEATNPCGEQPLLNYESCNLGSINLTKVIENNAINWKKLKEIVQLSVRFLDNVIEINKYPLKEIEKITLNNRKIGLGIMGWADMLAELGIVYGSKKSIMLAEEVMKFINTCAFEYSVELGKQRGSFPNLGKSIYKNKFTHLRNCTRTTIAPTGTISIIAGCSSGIEPFFAIAYMRKSPGSDMFEINPIWEKKAAKLKLLKPEIMGEIIKTGSLKDIKKIPKRMKDIFKTAFEISPKAHLLMQTTFQKHTDNAVSKTVNLPYEATIEEVKEIFINGWKMKCKGVTIFRYGSKQQQVLSYGENVKEDLEYLVLSDEISSCSKGICFY